MLSWNNNLMFIEGERVFVGFRGFWDGVFLGEVRIGDFSINYF